MLLEKVLKNGVKVFSLEVEENFEEAQEMLDVNENTSVIEAETVYNYRASNDFVATYGVKVERQTDFRRFTDMMEDAKWKHVREFENKEEEVRRMIRKFYRRGLMTREHASTSLDASYGKSCSCKMCKFVLSFEEWKSGKMQDGSRVGKNLRKVGFEQTLIDFYSVQIKTEKEVYLTISDLPQHIVGMSAYAKIGTFDGYKGTSCQDPRHGGTMAMSLAGALHDNKLFVAMLHDELSDLEDMTDKLKARSVMRLLHVDEVPLLVATNYYGNNETKDMLDYCLNQLEEVDIYGDYVTVGYTERVTEKANGYCNLTMYDDVLVEEDIDEDIEVDCPMCDGDGTIRRETTRTERRVTVTCPCCGGDGTVEVNFTASIDENIEVEEEEDIAPYYEGYNHSGHMVSMAINTDRVRASRSKFVDPMMSWINGIIG